MLKAIFFDLGDTLFDFAPMSTREIFFAAGAQTYRHLESRGCKLPPLKRYLNSQWRALLLAYFWSRLRFREFNSYHVQMRFARKLNLDLDEADMRDLAWRWYQPVCQHCTVSDDVIPTLRTLQNLGLKLAIVSNTFLPGFVLDRHLELHGLLRFFPVRIYSSEVGYRKPHPRIFQDALAACDVSADRVLFVGDRIANDIVGARRMGMRAVLRCRDGSITEHHRAHHVIRRISELPAILARLDSPVSDLPDADELACET